MARNTRDRHSSTDEGSSHFKDRDEDTESASSIVTETDGDSSFYGDEDLKQEYERKAQETDADEYWHVHEWNVQVIAARVVKQNPALWSRKRKRDDAELNEQDNNKDGGRDRGKNKDKSKSVTTPSSIRNPSTIKPSGRRKPYNPYEGLETALQIDEPVETFLERLQPSSAETQVPWIYCANFNSGERATKSDIAGFKQAGTRLLDAFLAKRSKLEAKFDPPKAEGVITRMLGPDRANLESEIMTAARKHDLTNGKWMLFPTKDKVDRYWEAVVRGTIDGRLGSAAKVATRPEKPEEPTQVICVYTSDMSDEADVKRVLMELLRLKLAPAVLDNGFKKGGVRGQIWYKPDCYSYLDITSGNEYKIKPTLYGTASLLTVADVRELG